MAETEITPSAERPVDALPCPKCEQTFTHGSGLASHLRSAHNIIDKEAHTRWQRRKKIIEARKGKGTGKFVCDFKGCGMRFLTPTGLGSHRRTHGISGGSSSVQQYHQHKKRVVIPTNKIVPNKKGEFICPECGEPFKAARALGRHRSTAHNIPGTAKSTVEHRARQQKLLTGKIAQAAEPVGLVLGSESDLLTCHCGQGPFKNIAGLRIHQTTTHGPTRGLEEGGELHGSNGTANSKSEIRTAYWLGRATERTEIVFATYADRTDLAAAEFTSRGLALLSGGSKALRQRYGIPD